MTTAIQNNLEKARRIDEIARDNSVIEVFIYPDGDIFIYCYYKSTIPFSINSHIKGIHKPAQLFILKNHKLIYRD